MQVLKFVQALSILLLYAEDVRTQRKNPNILILGAGMSGVAAAKKLKDLGYTNFKIIEGSARVGGRMYQMTMGGYTIEMGPVVVHAAPDNPILDLVNKYNVSIKEIDFDNYRVRDRNGSDVTAYADAIYEDRWEPAVELLRNITDPKITKHRPDFNLHSAFLKSGWNPNAFLDDVIEYYEINWLYGFGPEETSAIFANFAEIDALTDQYGEFHIKDDRGYAVIAQNLANDVLETETEKLIYNAKVTKIEEKDGEVTVTTDTEQVFTAEYVIVTFSLGVLQADVIEFKPNLPEWKTDAIQQFQMAQYTTVFIQFNTNFWDDNEWILYAGETDAFNVIFNMNKIYSGSNILSLEASNMNAVRVERLSDDEIKQEVIDKLTNIYASSNVVVPMPINFQVSRYSQHPLFRGAWSNWPPGYTRDTHYALQAPVGRVYFAGEHTHYPFYGYLHGAYLSGEEVGDKLDNCIQRSVCQSYVPLYAARGCRYTAASNYDHRAKQDDGTCQFPCVSASAIYKHSILGLLIIVCVVRMFT